MLFNTDFLKQTSLKVKNGPDLKKNKQQAEFLRIIKNKMYISYKKLVGVSKRSYLLIYPVQNTTLTKGLIWDCWGEMEFCY